MLPPPVRERVIVPVPPFVMFRPRREKLRSLIRADASTVAISAKRELLVDPWLNISGSGLMALPSWSPGFSKVVSIVTPTPPPPPPPPPVDPALLISKSLSIQGVANGVPAGTETHGTAHATPGEKNATATTAKKTAHSERLTLTEYHMLNLLWRKSPMPETTHIEADFRTKTVPRILRGRYIYQRRKTDVSR